MSFDIGKFETRTKSEDGAVMSLISPKTGLPLKDDEGNLVTITLRGRNSVAFKNAQRAVNDRQIENAARNIGRTPDSQLQDESDLLSACTVTWTFDKLDGEDFHPTPENIKAFWSSEKWIWIREQASRFIGSDANFLAT
jgi:hypothetical protein